MSTRQDQARLFKRLVIQRIILENIISFLLQYIGIMMHTMSPTVAPVWFDTGTACAYTFMRGYTVLPGIWLASILACYTTSGGIIVASLCASLLVLQAFSLVFVTRRYISPTLLFYRLKTLAAFIITSGIITAFITMALLLVCFSSLNFQFGYQSWLANLNGVLIFGNALIIWDTYFPSGFSGMRYGKCSGITSVFLMGLIAGLSAYLGMSVSVLMQLLLMFATVFVLAITC